MAGHNKWSKIKRQKAREDKEKSQKWAKLAREITVAAREGHDDPEMNADLAAAIERAEAENMPGDTIERAVKRGNGELEGQSFEPATYEGYAPHGVAVFVQATTDNNNRTVADLRHIFDTYGGNLGKDGSVSYLFERKGRFTVPTRRIEELMLFEIVVEAGAEDLRTETNEEGDEVYVITTPVERFDDVEDALDENGIEPDEAGIARIPTTTVSLEESDAQTVSNLVEELEKNDDVDDVYTTLS
ncbi:MAG: YebC/PmpR family DNA-binding transcriptional regulator [Bacteroidetes bacterium QS_7_67_15]|jgi:YebC/PmpR family DNA-binding regulatory protein|nr:MAG: YebC/PmpR family DNA-binding transcriptional regulator [Bacteroidetes bacterium QH_2_67_10]PSQ71055.1 MAG: YebC/PmpR family DNA-binding transcriptional regulator [Bacteroidetes bacterium QH_9_67_14]PSQ79277.1 MAG: YebC/PmpR family DNA-binding transcriptional regulator [Bacteroidetes bacterium QH_8_67_23]PSQ82738.1 MAG: YebC/PmpR family DNA-binding transcriptional regulator [Bacteroidetes bacterium QS_7_67_15]PSQ93690.1 MAG: YebC/PmpR family DNA-binding transcriptional regulator [Bactero